MPSTKKSELILKMEAYYALRAPVYDRVYQIKERQDDLLYLKKRLSELLDKKGILEIACGTGYWTQFIAPFASLYVATDASEETLELARLRPGTGKVEFRAEDAYQLSPDLAKFDAAFAGLWFSHVPREKWQDFISSLHQHLYSGALVVLLDNSDRQSAQYPITRTDSAGNSWQERELDDGSKYEVIKNFPKEKELDDLIEQKGIKVLYEALDHFWLYVYKIL